MANEQKTWRDRARELADQLSEWLDSLVPDRTQMPVPVPVPVRPRRF